MAIKFGVEIELIADEELNDFEVAAYHHGNYNDVSKLKGFWKIERDGSLSANDEDYNNFLSPKTAEFISKKLNMKDLKPALNIFKKFFNGDEYELNEIISFNKSCGCHIHFSDDSNAHKGFLGYAYFHKLREKTMERIRKELPNIYNTFKKHYFRDGYSQENRSIFIPPNREVEFNFTQLKNNRGIEWRAFNLYGVKTWEELFKLITIAIEEIDKMLKEYIKNGQQERLEVEIPEELISVYTAMNKMNEV